MIFKSNLKHFRIPINISNIYGILYRNYTYNPAIKMKRINKHQKYIDNKYKYTVEKIKQKINRHRRE